MGSLAEWVRRARQRMTVPPGTVNRPSLQAFPGRTIRPSRVFQVPPRRPHLSCPYRWSTRDGRGRQLQLTVLFAHLLVQRPQVIEPTDDEQAAGDHPQQARQPLAEIEPVNA